MGIGNIGWAEFMLILAFALIFFGPRRLPGIAQAIGKSLREFQKALNEVKSEIAQAGREADTGPELKRISPRPADFFTPDSAPGAPAAEEPETTEGAGSGESQDPGPEEKSVQHGDS
ncbi:MAG: twin-arginine translocase TatA/TatE family subunit [Gemmatimonadales bacterium]|jgi:Tat protein translocase TatB subunit